MFPRVRTLIVKPSDYYSLDAAPTLVVGSAYNPAEYPLNALTDGSAGRAAFRFNSGTGSVRLNLNTGNTKTPNIVGVFGHTFDVGQVVNIQASANPSMSPLLLNQGVGIYDPAFWLDLRGFALPPCDYWQLTFSGTSVPVMLGEFAVAYGVEFEGILNIPFNEVVTAPQERAELEYGSITISASGSLLRTCDLTLRLPVEDQVALAAIFAEAGSGSLRGTRVIVVPNSRRNDIWLTDWPAEHAVTFPESSLVATMNLPLVEEAYGIYLQAVP